MPLAAGTSLGPYEILAPLGAGGMGEVYRARDSRLQRTVAIKVLSAHFRDNADLKRRFEREAQAIAALNHPHICTLHDVSHHDGTDFLVMECLEGETLAQRLTRGCLPLDQVLRYGVEIADALDRAHRRGVVHRDLKPANIMLTKDGTKLLDFGLAKAKPLHGAVAEAESGPTQTALTGEGSIIGTLQYMAPEQLEGKEADARSDIFAFGAVFYEMATGRKAFDGKSQASLIAAILDSDPPPMRALQPGLPPMLDHLVGRCLAKDPDERWQSASDVKTELKWIGEESSQAATAGPVAGPQRRRERTAWTVASVSLGIAAVSLAFAVWSPTRTRSAALPRSGAIRFSVGDSLPIRLADPQGALAWSRDGRQLLYTATREGTRRLFLRSMSQKEPVPIPGTDGATAPFFSPDGQWAGFFAAGRLKKVSLSGGAPVTLADIPNPRGATWGPDDVIYFSPATDAGLMRVPTSGGAPQAVTTPDATRGERSHRWPEMLPGGKAILLTVAYSDILSFDDARLAVLSLETGKVTELLKGGSYARYAVTGHLLYGRSGAVLAAPFDPKRLAVTGPSATVLDGVVTYPANGAAQFAVSEAGSLAFIPGGSTEAKRTLTWVDRQRRATPVGLPPAAFQGLDVSPDGRSVALDIDGANASIWIHEFGRGGMTRLTLEWSNNTPVWTPDGARIVFSSARGGRRNLFWQASDGSGKPEPLTSSEQLQNGSSWSPDGKLLAFTEQNPGGGRDLWVLDRDAGTPRPFLQTPFDEFTAKFSPDGRFLAYVSDETGQAEVYVQPYPGPGRKWRISTDGGRLPVWARSGKELFYRSGDAMMSVEVTTGASFAVGTPRALFKYTSSGPFDVSPDGQRFLLIGETQPDSASAAVEVVIDWLSELERRASARR